MLFCVDYGDFIIKVFNYEGQFFDVVFGNFLFGKFFFVELDIVDQKFYWIDVFNYKIGRIDLFILNIEFDFIIDVGFYLDGFFVDSIYNWFFWASYKFW